ncbi:hypothetical protein EJ02DRAFT_421270 [Clathrospora elynae]|uniref:Uncharacterized protein n=1 Tax=Clathrospora elynae TaxID=706981 RepID=A0A6A5STE4_9PLEO|nr:hypothetical protein EJ02DRAFT_421270 [Clathrospora elynae]
MPSSTLQNQFYATTKLLSQLHGSNQRRPEKRQETFDLSGHRDPQQYPVRYQYEDVHAQRFGGPESKTIARKCANPPSSKFLDRMAKVFSCCIANTWMHILALGGTDGLPENWDILGKIIEHNSEVIDDYIRLIADMHTVTLTDLCRNPQTARQAQDLWDMCHRYIYAGNSGTTRRSIVEAAEKVRKLLPRDQLTQEDEKTRSTIRLLGVYPAAYETFRRTAQQDPSFKDIGIEFVEHTSHGQFEARGIKSLMEAINGQFCKPVTKPRCRENDPCRTDCHAEIQLIYHLEYDVKHESPHMYIGCSKKAY